MEDWIQIPFQMPANNTTVWVRTQRWSGAPFLATWKSNQSVFESVDNALDYPFYAIAYWRPQ